MRIVDHCCTVVQVEHIQDMLSAMKDRLLHVQEEVATKLQEYEHLVPLRQEGLSSCGSATAANAAGETAGDLGHVSAVSVADVSAGGPINR